MYAALENWEAFSLLYIQHLGVMWSVDSGRMKFSNVDIFVGIMCGMPESLDVCQLFSIDFHGTKAAKVQVICLKWFVGKAANALMLSLSLSLVMCCEKRLQTFVDE